VSRKRTIVYWEFVITLVGPRYPTKADRERVRRVLPKKRLKEIERVAWLATQAKLPAGFKAVLS
jgi:hypothetical protein